MRSVLSDTWLLFLQNRFIFIHLKVGIAGAIHNVNNRVSVEWRQNLVHWKKNQPWSASW